MTYSVPVPIPGQYRVLPGTEVKAVATAEEGNYVQGWQNEDGDAMAVATYSDYFVTTPENLFPAKSTLTFTMAGDTTAKAMFGINSYTVTATVNNDERETVGTGLPMGTVGATYTAVGGTPDQSIAPAAQITYTAQGGSTSTLTDIPETGYRFVKWNDDVTDNPRSVTIDGNFTALFEPDSFTITYMDGNVELKVDTFLYRQPITEYSISKAKWEFLGWEPEVPELMPAENLTVYAQWYRLCEPVTDIDNNTYQSVNISNKCWMAENLRTLHYYDGREITNIYEYKSSTYPNAEENVSIFGRLYDCYDAADASRPTRGTRIQGICPDGWFLPNEEDFEGLSYVDLNALRSDNYWLSNNGNNSTGFDWRPASTFNINTLRYENLHGNAYLWSSVSTSSTEAHCHMADCNCYLIYNMNTQNENAYSVRCIQD